jgi:hypothetical protein
MDGREHSSKRHFGFIKRGRPARRMMIVMVGALALCALAPTVAGAQVTWATNYIPVTKSTAMEWNGALKVKSTLPQTVECTDKAEGSIGANGTGEVTKLTTTKCKGKEGCSSSETGATIIPLNLPWHAELGVVGGTSQLKLVNGGKGTPGFREECIFLSVKIWDECSGTLSATTTNAENGVTAALSASEKLTCVHGSGGGTVEGSQSVSTTVFGSTLSVQTEEPVWLKEGLPITGEGKLIEWSGGKLVLHVSSQLGGLGVTCEDSGTGVAGAEGRGSITAITMSKCGTGAGSEECKGEYALEAKDLPWTSELYFGREKIAGDWFTNSGSGVPTIKLTCFVNGIGRISTECTGVHLSRIKNNTERGVFAEWGEDAVGLKCEGSAHGTGDFVASESHMTINLPSAETLHVS